MFSTTIKWGVRICVSIYQISQFYIYWKNMSFQNIIQQHKSGVGSVSMEPLHLRPYAIFSYICGFDFKKYIYYSILEDYGKKENID